MRRAGETAVVSRTEFGVSREGEKASHFVLTNRNGMQAEITNFGGILLKLTAPDRDGRPANVLLGYDSLAEYEDDGNYLGALIGRYGNRIAGGRFELDGETCSLAVNNDPNHLHGGVHGFNRRIWEIQPAPEPAQAALNLAYLSEDGEEGYPGKLSVKVGYNLTDNNELVIDYEAGTDRATPVNLTSHGYFNLSGDPGRDVLGHRLRIHADRYTPVDPFMIPSGEIRPVEGTPLDFRSSKAVGRDIGDGHEQIRIGGGFDHNFVLNRERPGELVRAATLAEPSSGRVMDVFTTEPGLQFYSGNFLDGIHEVRTGLCLETQHFPDSPNQPVFPSTILRPGQVYRSRTVHAFSVAAQAPT